MLVTVYSVSCVFNCGDSSIIGGITGVRKLGSSICENRIVKECIHEGLFHLSVCIFRFILKKSYCFLIYIYLLFSFSSFFVNWKIFDFGCETGTYYVGKAF